MGEIPRSTKIKASALMTLGALTAANVDSPPLRNTAPITAEAPSALSTLPAPETTVPDTTTTQPELPAPAPVDKDELAEHPGPYDTHPSQPDTTVSAPATTSPEQLHPPQNTLPDQGGVLPEPTPNDLMDPGPRGDIIVNPRIVAEPLNPVINRHDDQGVSV